MSDEEYAIKVREKVEELNKLIDEMNKKNINVSLNISGSPCSGHRISIDGVWKTTNL